MTNKSTQVTNHSADAIDYIITNSVSGHNDFKSTIVKTEVSDHFPILLALKTNEKTQKSTYKRSYCKKILTNLKDDARKTWIVITYLKPSKREVLLKKLQPFKR